MPSEIKKAFVMAGGRGVRLRPYTHHIPKVLVEVASETLLHRNLRLLTRDFDLETVYLVIGYMAETVRMAAEKSAADLGITIEFIEIPESDISGGLLTGYAAIKPFLEDGEAFISILGDEYYGGNDHKDFRNFLKNNIGYSACCGVKRPDFPEEYLKNYAVELGDDGKSVLWVKEKPEKIKTDFYGLGFVAATKKLPELAEEAIREQKKTTLIDLLNSDALRSEGPVLGYEFKDEYVNINNRTDVYRAMGVSHHQRTIQPTVDVIIPAWNEADSIGYVVRDFAPHCKNVIVMDNVSADGTAKVAEKAGATVYSEPLAGYGDAIKKGLDKSEADILIITEADGTFRSGDLPKLLAYLQDADAVIGTRTYWQYIEEGANMEFIKRMANIAYGLIITMLWWNRRSRFTDVGCSYRGMWRSSYLKIAPHLTAKGPEFAPEVTIELLNSMQRVIEVPLTYHPRALGESKFSAGYMRLSKTALRMLRLILSRRFHSLFRK